MEQAVQRVLAYIDNHREEYVKLVQELCRQPSIAATGEGIDDTIALVEAKLEELGADPTVCPTAGNPVITGFIPGRTDRTIGFYNHYDVQPADPVGLWTFPPYSAQIHNGAIYGRGTVDNKGGLAARICAVDAWLKTHGELPVNVKFFVEGEEEIGSPNLVAFARSHPEEVVCDGYMWEGGTKSPDARPEIDLGAKGMLYVELHSVSGERDVHSANAAILQSAVWRLVRALNTLKGPDERIRIEGFYDDIPVLSQQELDVLSADITDVDRLAERSGGHLLDGSREELLTRLYYQPTCNICGITAGYQGEGSKTVLPCRASAKLDFRLVAGQDPQKMLDLLRKHLDANGYEDIGIRCISMTPCYRTSPDSLFAKAAVRALERMYGQAPSIHYSSSGTSPMYAFCAGRQIPAAMFGATNKDANIHAPDEHLGITNYIENIKITILVMAELAAGGC